MAEAEVGSAYPHHPVFQENLMDRLGYFSPSLHNRDFILQRRVVEHSSRRPPGNPTSHFYIFVFPLVHTNGYP